MTAGAAGTASVDITVKTGHRYAFRWWTAATAGTVALQDLSPAGTAATLPRSTDSADGALSWSAAVLTNGGAEVLATSPTLRVACSGFAENDVIHYACAKIDS